MHRRNIYLILDRSHLEDGSVPHRNFPATAAHPTLEGQSPKPGYCTENGTQENAWILHNPSLCASGSY